MIATHSLKPLTDEKIAALQKRYAQEGRVLKNMFTRCAPAEMLPGQHDEAQSLRLDTHNYVWADTYYGPRSVA